MTLSVKKFLRALFSFLFVLVLYWLDQITKMWAVMTLKDKPAIPIIPGILELRYLENRGAAFGIMQNKQWFFVLITVIILGLILYIFFKLPEDKKYNLLSLLLLFIAAGAVGNLTDRLLQNYVVDFIYAVFINFPIFNVADMYVSVATTFLVISLLFYYKEEDFYFLSKKAAPKASSDSGTDAGPEEKP